MTRVFLSYARLDGAELAERLEADLEAREYKPWRDRSEIRSGVDWARQIEEAIDDCDFLLAVLTAGSYNSDICRGEQGRALRKKKRVIPLLAQENADRPVYLETKHYLDFAAPEKYKSGFAALLETLKSTGGVSWDDLSPRTRAHLSQEIPTTSSGALFRSGQLPWDDIRSISTAHRSKFMDALAPRPGAVGVFEPSLYTDRTDTQRELEDFVTGHLHGLILTGDPGVGKTNLLCHWSGELSDTGHAVFMYHCERFANADVERELAKDLGLEDPASLPQTLLNLDALAESANQRLIIVFDGVNDFRGSRDTDDQNQLLVNIDSLIASLPGESIRVVLSCSTATWSRLERLGPIQLSWNRYHHTADNEVCIVLRDFDEIQAGAAFEAYQRFFSLKFSLSDLPLSLRIRLREPLLLRLLAETYQTLSGARTPPAFDTLIFRRYYEERVRRRDDQHFIDAIVEEMWNQKNSAIPIQSVADHPSLGPVILSEDPDSSFNRLLELGVLLEVSGDFFNDDVVKFTYPLVGAYALARRLALTEAPLLNETVRRLVTNADRFALAWDAAVTLLAMRGDPDSYAQFAGESDPELRELASASVVRLQDIAPESTMPILESLLDSNVRDQQRTALRAAFIIGPAARKLLLRGAMSKSQSIQQAVKDTLYLIWSSISSSRKIDGASTVYFLWRHAEDFTHQMMAELVARVSWKRPLEAYRITRFVLDWCITLYINHCERRDVAAQVAELFHDLIVDRLHFDRVNLGSRIERALLRVIGSVFSSPILKWTLMEDPRTFFRRPASERILLARAAPLVDPAADVLGAESMLTEMLNSKINSQCGTATLILAIHSCANFSRCERLHRTLFDSLSLQGRAWQLVGFSVLLSDTPASWVRLLEFMTRQIMTEHPDIFFERTGLMKSLNILLVPLGLAYGKRGEEMPLLKELLSTEVSNNDQIRLAKLVAALGPVGFYYPRGVLALLQPHLEILAAEEETRGALLTTLATIRTLHFDLIDTCIVNAGLDEAFHRQVAITTDIELINSFMLTIGFFNNAVHQCLVYPRMRRWLTMFPLERLAQADSADVFIADYAERALLMAREASFDLLEFTRPESTQ